MNDRLTTDKSDPIKFSKLWILVIVLVAIYGFGILTTLTFKAYSDKPPIPELIVNENGETLFTGQDISEGQAIFLKYGLMDNGSIWGHGAYLGPDFSALYLHRLALRSADIISLKLFGDYYDNIDQASKAAIESQIGPILKENRYNENNKTLTFTNFEEVSFL